MKVQEELVKVLLEAGVSTEADDDSVFAGQVAEKISSHLDVSLKEDNTKVFLVMWSGAYVEDGDGISSIHRTRESAQTEADRLTAEENADRKKRRRTYPSTYYEVEEMELQP